MQGGNLQAQPVEPYAARQAMEMSAGMMHLGADMLAIEQDINRTRILDAQNKLLQHDMLSQQGHDGKGGWSNVLGGDVFAQQNSKPLTENVMSERSKAIEEITNSLGTEQQKTAFQQWANHTGIQIQSAVMGHEAKQYDIYKKGVLTQGIDTEINNIYANYSDPTKVSESIKSIHDFHAELGAMSGSRESGMVAGKKVVSGAIGQAINLAIAQNDHSAANKIMHEFGHEMELNDAITGWKNITNYQEDVISQKTADTVIRQNTAVINPGPGDRLTNIVLSNAVKTAESSNQHFTKSGEVTTSSEGAKGIMQLMPETAEAIAKQAGMPWKPELFHQKRTGNQAADDEAVNYNIQLGNAFLTQLMNKYKGDIRMTAAAYNMGEPGFEKALKTAPEGEDWLNSMPKETRDYVNRVAGEYNRGSGVPARPTELELKQQARALLPPNASPDMIKKTEAAISSSYKDQTEAIKQGYEAAQSQALQYIVQNGGRGYDDLPLELKGQINPKDISGLDEFAKKRASPETDLVLYNHLTSHPEALTKMSDDQFNALMKNLKPDDFQYFSKLRAKLNGATDGTKTPGDLNQSAISSSLNFRLQMLGIDTSPKKDDTEAHMRLGAIRQAVNTWMLGQQIEAGKKFDDKEINAKIDEFATKNVQFKSGLFGLFSSSGSILNMKAKNIHSDVRKELEGILKAHGIDDPTDGEIQQLYLTRELNNG